MAAQAPTPQFRQRVVLSAAITAAGLVLLYFLWQAVYVLLLVFAGILLAVLLRSLADLVGRWTRLREGWSLAIVVVGLIAVLSGIAILATPPLLRQIDQLAESLPQSLTALRARLETTPAGRWATTQPALKEMFDPGGSMLLSRATKFLSNAFNAVIAVLVIVFVGIYLAAEPRLYTDGVLRLVPQAHRPRAAEILGAIGYTLRWWLIGQGITMLAISVLTGFGLWLVGVPLWPLFAFLAGLFNFIPNFGPLVSFTPAVLLALAVSPGRALAVTVVYVIAQTVEGYLLTPMVQRRVVLLPPALTICVQVLLGVLIGALGVAVAAPLTAAVLVLVKMLYVEQALGDEIQTPVEDMKAKDVPPVPGGKGSKKD